MAWLSLFVMLALSQPFVRGVTYLANDEDNDYYKVPIPWGLFLFEGIVTEVCRSAELEAVCYESKKSSSNNGVGCIETEKKDVEALKEMARLLSARFEYCGRTSSCKPLFGVFVERKSTTMGEAGVVKGTFPVAGNSYRSEVVSNANNKEGQAFALCAKKA